jgi:uncharacterized membrane protein HdeD (DUF308 family)
MAIVLATNWWALLLRGVVAVIFGIVTFFVPGLTLAALVLWFAVFVIIEGIFNLIAAAKAPAGQKRWWSLLLAGLVSIAAGVVTVMRPAITGLFLLYLIAAWAIITGVLQIAAAVRLRRQIAGEWLLGLSGALSIAFGVLLYAYPVAGALAVAWIIGAYAFVWGIVLIALAFRLRGLRSSLERAFAVSDVRPRAA